MSIMGFFSYVGNKLYYIFFTVVSNYLLYFAFRKKKHFFFETFFSILLWLGFWFKFTFTISLQMDFLKKVLVILVTDLKILIMSFLCQQ